MRDQGYGESTGKGDSTNQKSPCRSFVASHLGQVGVHLLRTIIHFPSKIFLLTICEFHFMHPDHTHFLCLSSLYPTFTTSTLNLTPQKEVRPQFQFVLTIYSLNHNETPSCQLLREKTGPSPTCNPTRSHQVWRTTF